MQYENAHEVEAGAQTPYEMLESTGGSWKVVSVPIYPIFTSLLIVKDRHAGQTISRYHPRPLANVPPAYLPLVPRLDQGGPRSRLHQSDRCNGLHVDTGEAYKERFVRRHWNRAVSYL